MNGEQKPEEPMTQAVEKFKEPGGDIMHLEPGAVQAKLRAIDAFQAIIRNNLKEGLDYGIIPGTGDKPTLLKPGAEKVAKILNLSDHYEVVEKVEDWQRGMFSYTMRCTLREISSGLLITSAVANCNSMEKKYRYRWVPEPQIPAGVDKESLKSMGGRITMFEPEFALAKKETTGQYGKPAEHWAMFNKAIANGAARQVTRKTKKGGEMAGWEIDVDRTLYQVPNPEVYDQVNTILKMSEKRALTSAVLSAARLSLIFTVDLEDIAPEQEYSSGLREPVLSAVAGAQDHEGGPTPPPPAQPKPKRTKADVDYFPETDTYRYEDDTYPAVCELTRPDGVKVQVSKSKAHELFENMKGAIGEKDYQDALRLCGYEKKEEIPDEALPAVYDLLAKTWQAKKPKKGVQK